MKRRSRRTREAWLRKLERQILAGLEAAVELAKVELTLFKVRLLLTGRAA